MTVGAESHLRDGHLVWTVSIKCPGTREDTRSMRAVSPPPRVWMSHVASPGVDPGHRMPHTGRGGRLDLQPRYHLLHRPPAPGWRPAHSQYLMTAMLTGAVQVTARYCFSEAMAEEH